MKNLGMIVLTLVIGLTSSAQAQNYQVTQRIGAFNQPAINYVNHRIRGIAFKFSSPPGLTNDEVFANYRNSFLEEAQKWEKYNWNINIPILSGGYVGGRAANITVTDDVLNINSGETFVFGFYNYSNGTYYFVVPTVGRNGANVCDSNFIFQSIPTQNGFTKNFEMYRDSINTTYNLQLNITRKVNGVVCNLYKFKRR